jgi:hypothetical protein
MTACSNLNRCEGSSLAHKGRLVVPGCYTSPSEGTHFLAHPKGTALLGGLEPAGIGCGIRLCSECTK